MSMGRKRVLVVEDDAPIRDLVKEILEYEEFLVETAVNGQQALDLLRAAAVVPDVILLDLMMPVKDGFQFREEQRRDPAFAGIPVLIISADGNAQGDVERAGASGFLRKPVDIDVLIEAVKACSGRAA